MQINQPNRDLQWPLQASNGDTVIWTEHGCQHTGIVENDNSYEGGQRVGGRSLKNVWENAGNLRILRS